MDKQAQEMIFGWLRGDFSQASVERAARFMRDTLRIGNLRQSRALVLQAIGDAR